MAKKILGGGRKSVIGNIRNMTLIRHIIKSVKHRHRPNLCCEVIVTAIANRKTVRGCSSKIYQLQSFTLRAKIMQNEEILKSWRIREETSADDA